MRRTSGELPNLDLPQKMRSSFIYLTLATALAISHSTSAATLKWAGMRNPCKVSAGDGITDKQLGIKIGKFITLQNKDEWAQAIFNVSNRFPGAHPWATWAVGNLKDATALSDAVHEEYLTHMDRLGVAIFLEVWPSGADVPTAIDTWLGKFKHHQCVAGFAVDLEYAKKVDDATAKAWDERIKSHNPRYRLMLKHWEEGYMPPTYRGHGDLIFVDTSSEASMEALNAAYAKWAAHFAPSACAFMIGYPADEDGMDGKNTIGWWTLKDPIKDWGTALMARIAHPTQEIGVLWVCAKSGKSYNATWDLTKGAAVPNPAAK
jgi:hypothetical protein